MAYVIAEHSFETPLSDEEHSRVASKVDPCLAAYGVKWLRSYLSIDRLRMVCEFEAVDAEAVRDAHRSAGVTIVRAWSAHKYTVEGSST